MARITQDRCGKWWMSFAAPQPAVTKRSTQPSPSVGCDLGVSDTVTTSRGEFLNIPKKPKQEVQHLAELKRRQSNRTKGSNRYRRGKLRIAKVEARHANRRRDWIEKTTTGLIRSHDVIVVENLRVKNLMKSASGTIEHPGSNVAAKIGLNRSIAESCWGMFLRRLKDKATVVVLPSTRQSAIPGWLCD